MEVIKFILALVILGLMACDADKKNSPATITKQSSVIDSADLLSDTQEDSIFHLIHSLKKEVGSQIMILTIKSLDGRNINEFSNIEFNSRELGREKENDGLLIVIAVQEKQMRIEVGTGLEKIIKDDLAARINQNVMAPKFREGKFGAGIYNAVDTIKLLVEKNKALVGQQP
jgi:uncharacterized membrane protein YgcG